MNASIAFVPSYRESQLTGWHSVGAWAISFSYLLFCISDTLLSLEMDGSQLVKLGAFVLLAVAILLRPRFHKLIALIVPFMLALYIAMWRAFNVNAGGEEFLRFLAPMAITVAIFAYRSKLAPVLFMFFAVVLSNDLFQCYFYLAYGLKLPLFLPVKFDSGLYLRAQGWIGFFSEFSFINFCAFLVCRHYRPTRRSQRAAWIFLTFALLGVSFKIFATIAMYFIVARKLTVRSFIAALSAIGLVLFALMAGLLDSLIKIAMTKISFYVVAGNSARAESYRVMFQSLMKGNIFGEGLGSFGGPASVKYHSPLYSIYHFNWYGLGNTLTTTDTFYPHLFVELGVLGAILWLAFMLLYGQVSKRRRVWLFLVGAFCFDNIFSMSFVSASYVFSALMLMYLFSDNGSLISRPPSAAGKRAGAMR
ncbi:hypothetical protein [Paraburkholderia phytofirmans]|uniref:O-antigen polymerase n=1 Tax=Paraburkholderia phytofirmans (strain DSM 17436 / LMG 22146 / PsJN) TaxID=398527 RepID=B2TEB3_PARPJ|nr:hypothetical protein [Paraburkholderia phytofirmans]ACD18434.1 conserved hypothetical protein [Paraburkholderia phytofirmans PsJN]